MFPSVHEQNTAGVCAVDDEMRDAMGERIGLARTCSGNNKKGHARRACVFPNAMFDGPPLCRIELFKIGGGHGLRISLRVGGSVKHVSCFAHNASAAASGFIRAAFITACPAPSSESLN